MHLGCTLILLSLFKQHELIFLSKSVIIVMNYEDKCFYNSYFGLKRTLIRKFIFLNLYSMQNRNHK